MNAHGFAIGGHLYGQLYREAGGKALARTPAAIETYRQFLVGHGEPVDLTKPIETQVIAHITEGMWLGNGDPSIVFEPDVRPLTAEEAEILIARLEWMRAEMNDLVGGLSAEELAQKPAKGRSIQAISWSRHGR